jgi:hypothetical protein
LKRSVNGGPWFRVLLGISIHKEKALGYLYLSPEMRNGSLMLIKLEFLLTKVPLLLAKGPFPKAQVPSSMTKEAFL